MKYTINNFLKAVTSFLMFGMAIQSFVFKTPYHIVMGVMLLLISFLFFPYSNKFLERFKIKLSFLQKSFIIVSNFLITAISVNVEETRYYKCILPIIFMVIFWIITIIYSKSRLNKDKKIK